MLYVEIIPSNSYSQFPAKYNASEPSNIGSIGFTAMDVENGSVGW